MKLKHLKFSTLALLTAAVFATSCGNDDDESPAPTPNPTPPDTIQYSDAFGMLAAISVKVPSPVVVPGAPSEISMGTATATFYTAEGVSTFQDAGTVTLNQKTLTQSANKAYYFQPSQTDPTGIDFSGGVNWSVAGAGTVPAFTKSVPGGIPESATITSGTTITKSEGYTFTINPVSSGDSILFMIASGNTHVMKTVVRTATSATFSAAELSGLANSTTAVIQANVFRVTSEVVGGKKFYFVNQANTSKTNATVQ